MKLIALLLSAALGIVACGAVPGASPGTSLPDVSVPPDVTLPPELSVPPGLGEVPVELFVLAAEEAAAAANVAPGDVSLLRAQAATWPTPALGCPERDGIYAQVLTHGFWLVLEAGGRQFDFRAGSEGGFRLCPPGQGEPPIQDR